MSNLKGTIWVFKNTISISSSSIRRIYNSSTTPLFSINDGTTYQKLDASISLTYGSSIAYTNGEWKDSKYKTIEFLAEPEKYYPNKNTAIAWLEANATKIYEEREVNLENSIYTFNSNISLDMNEWTIYNLVNDANQPLFTTADNILWYGICNLASEQGLAYNSTSTLASSAWLPCFSYSSTWVNDNYKTITFLAKPTSYVGTTESQFISWIQSNASNNTPYFVHAYELTNIADIIRTKNGINVNITFPDGFINYIDKIACPFILSNDSLSTISSSAYKQSLITAINLPNCLTIKTSAFAECSLLSSINIPACSSIGSQAFQSCQSLLSIDLPECLNISTAAFRYCYKLNKVQASKCTLIKNNAFYDCINLVNVYFDACSTIQSYAFTGCYNLYTVSFPNCLQIESWAFTECGIETISFPSCQQIGSSAFKNCSSLSIVNFPACTTIKISAFESCYKLKSATFPACTYIDTYAFAYCSSLSVISFPKCETINNNAFYSCVSLRAVYLLGSTFITLASAAFAGTPIADSTYTGKFGSIYVPTSMLDSYKTQDNWSLYSSRLVGI